MIDFEIDIPGDNWMTVEFDSPGSSHDVYWGNGIIYIGETIGMEGE